MNNKHKLEKLILEIPRDEKITPKKIAEHLDKNNVIVLPCAIGSPIFVVNRMTGFIKEGRFRLDDLDQLGTRVFLNREDAEKKARCCR